MQDWFRWLPVGEWRVGWRAECWRLPHSGISGRRGAGSPAQAPALVSWLPVSSLSCYHNTVPINKVYCCCFALQGKSIWAQSFFCKVGSSVADPWNFGVDPDLDRVYMPLTNGYGSCYFRHWPSRCQQKTILKSFSAFYFLKVHLHHFQR